MGLLDKIKNMFTEEVEEEEIKKEVMQVEIPAPAKEKVEVKEKEEIKEEVKKEEKKVLPVYFDDKDFDDLKKREEIKIPKRENKLESLTEKISSSYKGGKNVVEEKKEEKHTFKPTPIISPIYGILDKNYKKDDVVTKQEVVNYYTEPEKVTIDDVRAKAYGTLEDELENTLFGQTSILFNDELDEDSKDENDIFADLESDDTTIESDIDDIINKYDDPVDTNYSSDEVTLNDENNNDVLDNNINEEVDDDLFNLIDSMYEKEDE